MRAAKLLLCSLLLAFATVALLDGADAFSVAKPEGHVKVHRRSFGQPALLRRDGDDDNTSPSDPGAKTANLGDGGKGSGNDGGKAKVDPAQANRNAKFARPIDDKSKDGNATPQKADATADASAKQLASGQGKTVSTGDAQSRLALEVLDQVKYHSRFEMDTFIETNLNYGDTGLFAELIYNTAFQTAKDAEFTRPKSDALGTGSTVGWNIVGQTKMDLIKDNPLSHALPASVRLTLDTTVTTDNSAYKGYIGLKNRGFWGIPVRSGTTYRASWFMRADKQTTVDLQYGLYDFQVAKQFGGAVDRVQVGPEWKQVNYTFTVSEEAPDLHNVFAILFDARKGPLPAIQVNLVSLFPPTWKDTTIRQDGAQALLDFRPRAVRTPGGNDLSGFSPLSRFRWNNTIGPDRYRPGRAGNWAGWNTEHFGVVEAYNFITRLGAKIIVGLFDGTYNGDKIVDLSEMAAIVEDQVNFLRFLLDADGEFAEMRVKAGGPKEPYQVSAVLVGNESGITAGMKYDERYGMMEAGIKKQFFSSGSRYPMFDIIATAPVKVAKGHMNNLDTLNDPKYGVPNDFIGAYHQYDGYERNGTIYYNLEFAVINSGLTDDDNPWSGSSRLEYTTLQSSLAEGVFLLGLERNADICAKAAYAPQMAAHADPREDQSTPGQLIFDPSKVVKSSSYLVQQAFGRYHIDQVHAVKVASAASSSSSSSSSSGGAGSAAKDVLEDNLVYFSAGSDNEGRVIAKLINYDAQPKLIDITFPKDVQRAEQYIVTGKNPQASNTLDSPYNVEAGRKIVDASHVRGRTVTVTLQPYSMNAVAVQ
ncbi:uncharacterized protein PFL1_01248 [Pseudozyma flocculosa PF-1]|uniref:non-reducing end alpha-L-arabinofuranosidase n=1 Tax=Pseudozyma flocculosa TaxID=84751 RepID=A0A5C3EUB8_9BASI|nr:uncharacterized protein PFL1_01248 [Pseudozyma flocculosa PF-1]EPQ31059.1 hypothetical protein PFL1_01248 [Pseudozyma flocculosa PF-1]SPO35908.1 related to alpha-L-arabinofuranosidase I precursor [Pseudozyma flocculosa]